MRNNMKISHELYMELFKYQNLCINFVFILFPLTKYQFDKLLLHGLSAGDSGRSIISSLHILNIGISNLNLYEGQYKICKI